MLRRILFSADPAEGGDNTPAPAPAPAPAAPPVAKAVIESDAKEGDAAELVRLKRERDDAIEAKKKVELRAMELEDNLRTLTTPPKPTPVKVKRDKLTFFDEDED